MDVLNLKTESLGGAKYLLVLVDQFSGFLEIYAQKHIHPTTGEVSIPHSICVVKNSFTKSVSTLRADLGAEFVTKKLEALCREEGIWPELAATATPMHNGQVERANRSIGEAMKAMLLESNLQGRFWAEAASMCVHVHNLLPRKNLKGRSVWWVFTGKREPQLPRFSFGQKVNFWTQPTAGSKLRPRRQ